MAIIYDVTEEIGIVYSQCPINGKCHLLWERLIRTLLRTLAVTVRMLGAVRHRIKSEIDV